LIVKQYKSKTVCFSFHPELFNIVEYEYLEDNMATTSLSLEEHWEIHIKNEIASRRYGFDSEVVRDALHAKEERNSKLDALPSHLAQGANQAASGEYTGKGLYFACLV
jgi:antitoxin ParD1/3/4